MCILKKKKKILCILLVSLVLLMVLVTVICSIKSGDPQEAAAAAVEETAAKETDPEGTLAEETDEAESFLEKMLPKAVHAEESVVTEPVSEENVSEETDPAAVQEIPVETIPSLESLRETGAAEDYMAVPLYFQTDYPNNLYGGGSIANNGCSVTCLAMVATYLTGHEYLPDELARYFGGVAENNIERLEKGATAMQLPWEKMENFDKAMAALQEGKVVIALMGSSSLFTQSQHFIVLTGFNENGLIMVNDPIESNYSKWDTKRAFREGFSKGDVCAGVSGAWAFDKSAMPEEPFIYYEENLMGDPRYPNIQLTYSEKRLLASVVWVEARGEPKEGQQAVAEVILNRLASDRFPDTLKGIVYADNQFRSAAFLEEATPEQAQFDAVEHAIYGPYILPEDVVHFATYNTNEYVWGQIGGHIFCYQG